MCVSIRDISAITEHLCHYAKPETLLPPLQSPLASQAQNCCSDRAAKLPFLTALAPSSAATAEKTQHVLKVCMGVYGCVRVCTGVCVCVLKKLVEFRGSVGTVRECVHVCSVCVTRTGPDL